MPSIYSKERANKSALFQTHLPRSLAAYDASFDASESQEIEATRVHREPPIGGDLTGWAGIDNELCALDEVEFLYASEREFARLLDAQDISWHYKPRTFTVEWDDEGNFVDCFTPDFYLSASETYIALIAADCHESNQKIRSVNLLRRQHPEIRIEVLHSPYRRH